MTDLVISGRAADILRVVLIVMATISPLLAVVVVEGWP